MRLFIDRFEGQFAICEKGGSGMIKIARQKIPAEAREGDVLIFEQDCFKIDVQASAERKKAAARKFQKLRQPD
jgi:hypothetical protein